MDTLNTLVSLLKPASELLSELLSEPSFLQVRVLRERHGERSELWVAVLDKKNFVLDIAVVDTRLSQRWNEIDNGSLTSRPMPLPINPKTELDSLKSNSSSDVYRLASTASAVHAFYLDSKRYPDLYKDDHEEKNFNSPAQVAASATYLHPQTALLILEDEIKKMEKESKSNLTHDELKRLACLASKEPTGLDTVEKGILSSLLNGPEVLLELIKQKPDIKLPDSMVSLISFPDGKTIEGIDFSKLEKANLIDTKNIVFEFCTFGPNMSKEQLATAKGFRNCTFAKELGLGIENFEGERIVFYTETPPPKFPTVEKPTPPPTPSPNLCPSGTNSNEPHGQHIPNKGSGGFAK